MSRKRIKPRLPQSLTIFAAVIGTVLLAACGSSSKSATSTSSGSSAGVSRANAVVASLNRPTTSFHPPGPPLKDVKKLRGKTVWYIPISLSVPVFAVGNSALHTALGKAGVGARLQWRSQSVRHRRLHKPGGGKWRRRNHH